MATRATGREITSILDRRAGRYLRRHDMGVIDPGRVQRLLDEVEVENLERSAQVREFAGLDPSPADGSIRTWTHRVGRSCAGLGRESPGGCKKPAARIDRSMLPSESDSTMLRWK